MQLVLRCLFVLSLLISNYVFAIDSLQDLRKNYQQWRNTYQKLSIDDQEVLLKSLDNYPLYPYAAMQFLQRNIYLISKEKVIDFINKYPDFPYTSQLIQDYLADLTKKQDWQAIITFPRDKSINSNCRYYYALFKSGDSKTAFNEMESLWKTGKELPSTCDPLIDAWSDAGFKTANSILFRIGLAIELNNLKFAIYLTQLLPDNYKTVKTELLALINDPKNLINFSKQIKSSHFTKHIILASYARLARADMNLAYSSLSELTKQQNLSQAEVRELQKKLANSFFNDSVTLQQKTWRDSFIAKSQDTQLIEKRIRLAIDEKNYHDIEYWINKLAITDKHKDDWQYWLARVFINKNQKNKADLILKALQNNRGFYAMVSAQQLNNSYQITDNTEILNKSQITELIQQYEVNSNIKRIEELRYQNMLSESLIEWKSLIADQNTQSYINLAQYAFHKGWGDLSIQATIAGKLWDYWQLRLPIMYKDLYQKSLRDKAISLSYVLAISRQESAFNTNVQSLVGASGLMQIMPATAKDVASKINDLTYQTSSQLFNPEMNIKLGTYYLNNVYVQNDNNRILAAAAYNAGPTRVKQWLKNSNGQLDAIEFIESIPFNETRNYVKNVLVYDYIYKIFLKQKTDAILYKNELNRYY